MLIHIAEIGLAWIIAAGIVAWVFAAFMHISRQFAKDATADYHSPSAERRAHRA